MPYANAAGEFQAFAGALSRLPWSDVRGSRRGAEPRAITANEPICM